MDARPFPGCVCANVRVSLVRAWEKDVAKDLLGGSVTKVVVGAQQVGTLNLYGQRHGSTCLHVVIWV